MGGGGGGGREDLVVSRLRGCLLKWIGVYRLMSPSVHL